MIGIISDIHGNFPALKAVLDEMDRYNCSHVISLGDVCGYYCMINECINELRNRQIINILGNHDDYIIHNKKCGRSYTANLCLDYQRNIIEEKNFIWLEKSVEYFKEDKIWMVHGGWNDYLDEYITDFSFLDEKADVKLYVSGHTHVARVEKGSFAEYLNPGSVGQPRDHDSRAAYAIIEDNGNIKLGRVEYDIDWIAYEMEKSGFPERVSSCLYGGLKIGEDGK